VVTALLYLAGVVAFAVAIAVSIGLHEVGHLAPAKRFGVRVTQYMIGFGPTVWSRKSGDTEYGVKAIPLGGYIRMIGMFPPKRGDDPRFLRRSSTGRLSVLADQARAQSMEELKAGDEDRVFYKLSVPKKVVVMMGGPTMNLLIAAVLLTITTSVLGMPAATTTLGVVNDCVLPASATTTSCSPSDPKAPASAAGLRPGDRIVSYAGVPITSWNRLHDQIRVSRGTAVPVVVERAGRQLTLSITPIVTDRPVYDAQGRPEKTATGQVRTERIGFLGVSPTQQLRRESVTAVPGVLWQGLSGTAGVVLRIPQKMVGVAQAAFGSGQRDPNGPVSIVGVGRITGEATTQAPDSGFGWRGWLVFYFGIIAALNIALFIFNLIPLLPLDGGHVAGALWEGARRTVARLRHRADPGPTDVARLLPIAYAASAVLIAMSVLLIYADIVNPINLG
jgi:membrane-associated protease RseP (regulator of RpoE activity)